MAYGCRPRARIAHARLSYRTSPLRAAPRRVAPETEGDQVAPGKRSSGPGATPLASLRRPSERWDDPDPGKRRPGWHRGRIRRHALGPGHRHRGGSGGFSRGWYSSPSGQRPPILHRLAGPGKNAGSQEAGLVKIREAVHPPEPNTNVALTATGKQRIAHHWDQWNA